MPATLISGSFSCWKTASKQLRRPLIVLTVSVLAAMTYGHENCRVCSRTRSHDSVIFAYFSDSYFVSYGEFGELIIKLLRAALAASRSRAWSIAIGRSGLGCHCEKGEPVTARKANHNASNAKVVTAGKMVCVSVKYRRPNRWTDQIWHAYADGPGDGSYLKKLTFPPKGGGSKWEF